MGENIKLLFSDENVFQLISYPISLVATPDTYSCLRCSGWGIRGSFICFSYTEPSWESVIFMELFQHIGFRWIKMLLYAQHFFYVVPIVVYVLHNSRSYHWEGK